MTLLARSRRGASRYVCADPLVTTNEARINNLALNARLPTMHGLPENAAAGGLMAYGVDMPALCRRAAEIVYKIQRGAKPAEIPVEQPRHWRTTGASVIGGTSVALPARWRVS